MRKIKAEIKAVEVPEVTTETTTKKEDQAMAKKKAVAAVVPEVEKAPEVEVTETAPKKKKVEAKPKSCITIMTELLKKKATDKEIVKVFTGIYNAKGQMDAEFITKRIAIYRKIAGEKEA